MSDEAREAAMTQALEALNWKSLTTEEMVAFILGAVVSAERSGIRQAREAVSGELSDSGDWGVRMNVARGRALAAIDALGEADRG